MRLFIIDPKKQTGFYRWHTPVLCTHKDGAKISIESICIWVNLNRFLISSIILVVGFQLANSWARNEITVKTNRRKMADIYSLRSFVFVQEKETFLFWINHDIRTTRRAKWRFSEIVLVLLWFNLYVLMELAATPSFGRAPALKIYLSFHNPNPFPNSNSIFIAPYTRISNSYNYTQDCLPTCPIFLLLLHTNTAFTTLTHNSRRLDSYSCKHI